MTEIQSYSVDVASGGCKHLMCGDACTCVSPTSPRRHWLPRLRSPVSRQVWLCLLFNVLLTLGTIIAVVVFRDSKSKYFRIGPQEDLFIVSIHVNSWIKWSLVIIFIGLTKICDVLVNEIGSPILGFNVYNPDKKIITEFTKNELNTIANAMWFANGMRSVLMVVVNVTQIDFALSGMLVSQTASIFTVRFLLNKKTFCTESQPEETVSLV